MAPGPAGVSSCPRSATASAEDPSRDPSTLSWSSGSSTKAAAVDAAITTASPTGASAPRSPPGSPLVETASRGSSAVACGGSTDAPAWSMRPPSDDPVPRPGSSSTTAAPYAPVPEPQEVPRETHRAPTTTMRLSRTPSRSRLTPDPQTVTVGLGRLLSGPRPVPSPQAEDAADSRRRGLPWRHRSRGQELRHATDPCTWAEQVDQGGTYDPAPASRPIFCLRDCRFRVAARAPPSDRRCTSGGARAGRSTACSSRRRAGARSPMDLLIHVARPQSPAHCLGCGTTNQGKLLTTMQGACGAAPGPGSSSSGPGWSQPSTRSREARGAPTSRPSMPLPWREMPAPRTSLANASSSSTSRPVAHRHGGRWTVSQREASSARTRRRQSAGRRVGRGSSPGHPRAVRRTDRQHRLPWTVCQPAALVGRHAAEHQALTVTDPAA
jgi:hypothetical protein